MRIGFYGGVREIGSNIILIEDKGNGIVFDFGRKFKSSFTFFNPDLPGRIYKGIDDYVLMGELPPFRGFYKKSLTVTNILDVDINGIFFSHAHLDHIGNIDLISDKVPKFLSEESIAVLKYFVKFGFISQMPKNTMVIADKKSTLGNFRVTAVPVDHDIPGATSFFIETPKGLVIYTGDLFFKGINKEKTLDFVKKAKMEKPYILITEGTRINWGSIASLTEDEIQEDIKLIAKTFNGMIIANPYEPHAARIYSFYKVAKDLKKKLVLTLPYVYSLTYLSKAGNMIAREILEGENTLIYNPSNKEHSLLKQKKDKFVSTEFVKEEQTKIILVMGFRELPELIDVKPGKGAVYIHSGGEPITSVDSENGSILMNWVNYFGLPYFRVHSPGHASEVEILDMVKEINPKIILPIHTQLPERFSYVSGRVKILEKGVMQDF